MSMDRLEVVQVNHGAVNNYTSVITIIAKDKSGNMHEIPFLVKNHYLESIKKSFSRMSPTKVRAEVKDGQH